MKRFSIYILFSLSILALVVSFDFFYQTKTTREFYQKDFFERADQLSTEVSWAKLVFESTKSEETLLKYLDRQRDFRGLEFWFLFDEQNRPIKQSVQSDVSPIAMVADDLRLDVEPRQVVQDVNGRRFYSLARLSDGKTLVVGLVRDEGRHLQEEAGKIWSGILWFLAGVLTITVGTFSFFFQDIMRSIRGLGDRRRRSSMFGGLALSREADVLARGLSAFDEQAETLRSEREKYRWQILPSLRTELESGIEPPYDFACTLVRTDINNFTKIYNNHSVSEFMESINVFFTAVSEIVSRYGGYVHEFIGDEVIFYFKDDEVGNSVSIALAAIEDIHELAKRLDGELMRERGYPFTVKTALASGRLRFGRLVNGHGLSGPALIETVRILSHISEKDENVAVFDERHGPQVERCLQTGFYAEVGLKGFSEQRRLLICRGRREISEFLVWSDETSFSQLLYYRSDRDLERLFLFLAETHPIAPERGLLRVLGILRAFILVGTDGRPLSALVDWLEQMERAAMSPGLFADEERQASRVFASAIRVVENCLDRKTSAETLARVRRLLEAATRHSDARVAANSVEVMSALENPPRDRIASLMIHIDNRIAANALVVAGKGEITESVLHELKQMLRSRHLTRIASGAYALGEICAFHMKRDPVYFRTQVGLLELVEELPDLALHEFESIRRQARTAIAKMNDQDLSRRLLEREGLAQVSARRA